MGVCSLIIQVGSLKNILMCHSDDHFVGVVMFVSYFVSGFIPLLPISFCGPQCDGLFSVGVLSLLALFLLGVVSARLATPRFIMRA